MPGQQNVFYWSVDKDAADPQTPAMRTVRPRAAAPAAMAHHKRRMEEGTTFVQFLRHGSDREGPRSKLSSAAQQSFQFSHTGSVNVSQTDECFLELPQALHYFPRIAVLHCFPG